MFITSQYVYHCCLLLIVDQTSLAQEQKNLSYRLTVTFLGRGGGGVGNFLGHKIFSHLEVVHDNFFLSGQ